MKLFMWFFFWFKILKWEKKLASYDVVKQLRQIYDNLK